MTKEQKLQERKEKKRQYAKRWYLENSEIVRNRIKNRDLAFAEKRDAIDKCNKDQALYDFSKIRKIPGFDNLWMTIDGNVYDSRLSNLHGVSVEGMVTLKIPYVDNVALARPVLVYADELYRKVWNRSPPKDTWVPGEDNIKMDIRDAMNIDMIRSMEIYEPESNVGAKKLKEINEKLVEFLKEKGYDIKKILMITIASLIIYSCTNTQEGFPKNFDEAEIYADSLFSFSSSLQRQKTSGVHNSPPARDIQLPYGTKIVK